MRRKQRREMIMAFEADCPPDGLGGRVKGDSYFDCKLHQHIYLEGVFCKGLIF